MRTATLRRRERSTDDRYLTRLDRALALPCPEYRGPEPSTGWVGAVETAHKAGVFRKINRYGWEVLFEVPASGPVLVSRRYRGAPAGEKHYLVEEARAYYDSLTRQGFTSVGVGL